MVFKLLDLASPVQWTRTYKRSFNKCITRDLRSRALSNRTETFCRFTPACPAGQGAAATYSSLLENNFIWLSLLSTSDGGNDKIRLVEHATLSGSDGAESGRSRHDWDTP